jgi:ABC-type uncharacterized transport system substrate-binding protein
VAPTAQGDHPRIKRVAIVVNPQVFPLSVDFSRSAEAAAPKFAGEAVMAPVHHTAEIEAIMATLGASSDAGAIFPVDPFTFLHRKFIVALAARHHVPAIYGFREFIADGALVSDGADQADAQRKAADMSIAFCGARNQGTCQSNSPPNSSWSSHFTLASSSRSRCSFIRVIC